MGYYDDEEEEFDQTPLGWKGHEWEHPLESLPEDMYGVAIGSLIKDSFDSKAHGPIKTVRVCTTLILFVFLFGLQAYLVVQTKKLVTPFAVNNARTNYGQFEKHMYTDANGVVHTYKTANGYDRGIDKAAFFNPANFATLDKDVKANICMVPLSNVPFLFALLLIWALYVLNEVKEAVQWIARIISLKNTDLEDDDALVSTDDGVEVTALPVWLKLVIIVLVLLPKIILCSIMLWLGARWLTATLGFGDVLLNAVALAFIFDLASLLYNAVIPFHTKLLTQRTFMAHVAKKEQENCCSMFGLMLLLVFAASLALLYIYKLQQVLPDYKWDVAGVCAGYLATELAV